MLKVDFRWTVSEDAHPYLPSPPFHGGASRKSPQGLKFLQTSDTGQDTKVEALMKKSIGNWWAPSDQTNWRVVGRSEEAFLLHPEVDRKPDIVTKVPQGELLWNW